MHFPIAKLSQRFAPRIYPRARPKPTVLPHSFAVSFSRPFSAAVTAFFRPTTTMVPPIHQVSPTTAKGSTDVVAEHQKGIISTEHQPHSGQPEWSVEKALKQFDIPKISQSPTTPLPFLHVLTRLKTTPREGWRRFGIENGESISDHMYRMAIITMLAPPSLAKRLNLAHCAKMALVHDMAECLVGDITPVDNVAKNEKSRREATTMDFLTSKLLGSSAGATGLKEAGEGIKEIWQEYEDSKTPEAIFVHDVDKFELVLQMVEYEKAQRRKTDLGEFMYVANKVQTPEVRKWCVAILKERMELWGDEYEDLKEGVQEGRQLLEKYRAEGGEEFPEL